MENILTVTELTANIKMLLETSFDVLWVAGEVSNLREPGSGHVYFTLKDEQSQIRGVIFRPAAEFAFDHPVYKKQGCLPKRLAMKDGCASYFFQGSDKQPGSSRYKRAAS
jgi:hypothetical protein